MRWPSFTLRMQNGSWYAPTLAYPPLTGHLEAPATSNKPTDHPTAWAFVHRYGCRCRYPVSS